MKPQFQILKKGSISSRYSLIFTLSKSTPLAKSHIVFNLSSEILIIPSNDCVSGSSTVFVSGSVEGGLERVVESSSLLGSGVSAEAISSGPPNSLKKF